MSSLMDGTPVRHPVLPETANRTAKADLRKSGTAEHVRRAIGQLVGDIFGTLTLKEVSACIEQHTGKAFDERQLARWISGQERPQFEFLCSVPEFRVRLFKLGAQRCGLGVTVATTVTIVESA